jgi:hypothetical protein
MADGLCAVDAGSAAEWKPVASVTETRCATHLARRIEATAAARGLPRAHPWTAPHPRGRSRPGKFWCANRYCLASGDTKTCCSACSCEHSWSVPATSIDRTTSWTQHTTAEQRILFGRRHLTPRRSMTRQTRGSLCARRLSSTTMSPGRSLGARRHSTHRTNRSAFAVCHAVANVSHRSPRIAPIMVRLLPQFIGRGSTTTWPLRTHACERPIARLAPDSSTNTSRAGSMRAAQARNAARAAWTSGRSCSAGRGRFF